MAGIVQAITETFPNNCTIMFPQAPAPIESFSSTFRPASSKEEEDDDDTLGPGIHRFDSSTPVPSGPGHGSSGHIPSFSSTPLPYRGHFIMLGDWKEAPNSSLGMPPPEDDEHETQPLDEDLDAGLDAYDEGN